MAKLVNLTGHEVVVRNKKGNDLIIPATGMFKIRYTTRDLGIISTDYGDLALTQNVYHRVKNPPPIKDGVLYIVSRLVAELYPERNDFLITNGLIKDSGRPIACRSLGRI